VVAEVRTFLEGKTLSSSRSGHKPFELSKCRAVTSSSGTARNRLARSRRSRGTGWPGTRVGRELTLCGRYNTLIQIVAFASYEDAMANSALPETGASAEPSLRCPMARSSFATSTFNGSKIGRTGRVQPRRGLGVRSPQRAGAPRDARIRNPGARRRPRRCAGRAWVPPTDSAPRRRRRQLAPRWCAGPRSHRIRGG
jgi:hypothetical protein